MYAGHFGLIERPFSLAPDPRYLFMSDGHREALAHLLFGLGEGGNFVQLTGEVGTGKTTVCRALLEQLPAEVDVAMIFNPRLTSVELVASVCDELRVPYLPGTTSLKVLVDALSRALLETHARGRRTVLIVDEAQNLSMEVLEDLRLLTNLETTRHKLLQVMLIGQPELADLLRRRRLRQLAQRVTARYHLQPFTAKETRAYVEHRMAVAGQRVPVFTDAALRVLHRHTRGVPRLINSVSDRALMGAYAAGRKRVTARVTRRAANEVLGRLSRPWWVPAAVAGTLLVVVGGAALTVGRDRMETLVSGWGAAMRAVPVPGDVSPALSAPLSAAPPVPAPPEPVPPAPPRSEAAGAPLAPPQPSLAAMFSEGAPLDRHAAFAALYAQWGVRYRARPGALGCDFGRRAGLRCLVRAGNWETVRRLGLPAMLTLTSSAGGTYYAVLTAVGESSATLVIGDRAVTLPLGEIAAAWDGEFVALWKPPTVRATPLRPGMGGRDIAWLRQRLGHPGAPGADVVYDDDLRQRVVAFQQAHALKPDGIVGEETLLRLAVTAPEPGAPSLMVLRP